MRTAAMYEFNHPTSDIEIKTLRTSTEDASKVNEALREGWHLLCATVVPGSDRNSPDIIVYMFERRVQSN